MNTNSHCPSDADLRRFLDGELVSLEAHISGCPACRERRAAMEADASSANRLLQLLEPERNDVNVAAALHRLRQQRRTPDTNTEGLLVGGIDVTSLWNRRGFRVASAAVGVFALLMVLTVSPMGSFASTFMDRFRVQKFEAITIDLNSFQDFQTEMLFSLATSDQNALMESVMNLGDVTSTFDQEDPWNNVQAFDSAEEAEAAFGEFDVPSDVPDGYADEPEYYVSDAGDISVTINTAEAQSIIDELGLPIYSLPDPAQYPELNFTMNIPQGLILHYEGATPDDHIFVARMMSPTLITPDGLDMNALREDVLALPGLPPDFVAQLRSIQDWQETLVIPIMPGMSSEDVTIDGEPGLLITMDDEDKAVVLWEQDGDLFIVGGTEAGDVVLDIANSLD